MLYCFTDRNWLYGLDVMVSCLHVSVVYMSYYRMPLTKSQDLVIDWGVLPLRPKQNAVSICPIISHPTLKVKTYYAVRFHWCRTGRLCCGCGLGFAPEYLTITFILSWAELKVKTLFCDCSAGCYSAGLSRMPNYHFHDLINKTKSQDLF